MVPKGNPEKEGELIQNWEKICFLSRSWEYGCCGKASLALEDRLDRNSGLLLSEQLPFAQEQKTKILDASKSQGDGIC
jgi:hypothetical protein